METLERIDSTELTYYQIIAPLHEIAQEAKKGGARRLIARERFRKCEEESPYGVFGDFQDFLEADHGFDLLMDDHVFWAVYFEGPGICWTEDIDTGSAVVDALMADERNSVVIAVQEGLGYVYVVRSPNTGLGRFTENEDEYGIHPFPAVVIHEEDHPDYRDVEGYAMPREVMEYAEQVKRDFIDD
tara:strand:- start:952 stop:1509 length:558 start_codon:yes stop_codon:yes gene_type:complete